MRISEETKGVYIIAATPFAEDGALDLASAESLTDFYLEAGVHGMTILGIMGEAPKLTAEESVTFLSTVLARVAGRVPVIVGVSNPGLDNLARLAKTAMDKGAAGVMVRRRRSFHVLVLSGHVEELHGGDCILFELNHHPYPGFRALALRAIPVLDRI